MRVYHAPRGDRKHAGQTYAPLKWFVVSDNPQDGEYARAINEHMKATPTESSYSRKRKGGAQVARNRGIPARAGEYIACLDDDDLWTPGQVEDEMKLFVSDDVGVAFCYGYAFTSALDNVTTLYHIPNAFKEFSQLSRNSV